MSARALRDFSLALRSRAFRVALVLSLLVHLVLLIVLGRENPERAGGKKIPLMRVRILPQESKPAAAPVAPLMNF